jgi:glycosyltransferase involved in cell wall biosynthesis
MTTDIQHMIDEDPDTKGKLNIIDDATDEEIVWLYENCMFSVYPSFYEGWGLPLAESAHYGKICLASDSSSIPEVLGPDAVYFSPFDSQECLQKIVKFSNNSKLRSDKERILAKRRIWSWDDAQAQLDSLL